jgi:hypothetical protein
LGNGANDEALQFNAGKRYEDPAVSFGTFSTNDFTVGIVGKGIGANGTVVATHRNPGVSHGWQVFISGTSLVIRIETSTGSTDVTSGTIDGGAFIARVYVDRSGFAQWYVNGAASGAAVDVSARSGTLDDGTNLNIGATTTGGGPYDAGVVLITGHEKSGWFSTHLNASHAAEEFYKWSGLYPKRATGTALPTAYTRAGSAYAMKWNGTSYDMLNCGSGVPRVDYVKDDSGVEFKGMLIEPAATNLLTYSNDLSTGWTGVRATFDNATGITTPDSAIDFQGIVASADVTTSHYGYLTYTATTANTCLSAICKKGDQDWVAIVNLDFLGDPAAPTAWFNLSTGAKGSSINGVVDYGIDDLGGGIYRVWQVSTNDAGAAFMAIFPSPSDGSFNFTGDASTVSTYAAFAQVELGTKPTSRIVTSGATVTRPADSLQYNGDNVTAGQGAFVADDVLIDDHAPSDNAYAFAITDGSATNRIIHFSNTTPITRFVGTDAGVGQWSMGAADWSDGDAHKIRAAWETNNAKLFFDGVQDGTPDTSCTIPTGLTDVDIGQYFNDTDQLNGRIRNVQIWAWPEENLG